MTDPVKTPPATPGRRGAGELAGDSPPLKEGQWGRGDFTHFLSLDIPAGPVERESSTAGWGKRLGEVAKHPLTILLVSTALIPFVIFLFNQSRATHELRQKKALEIIEKNSAFEGQLYSLYIDLGLFHESNKSLKPSEADLKTRLDDFEKRWGARYADFTKSYSEEAVWANDLYRHAIVLDLIGENEAERLNSASLLAETCPKPEAFSVKIERDIAAYKCNVLRSLGVIGDYRRLFNDKYDYNSADVNNKISGQYNERYNKLRAERSAIVNELVKDFSD